MCPASNIKNKFIAVIILFLFILSLNFVASMSLGLQPSELNLNGMTGEKICSEINVTGNSSLIVRDRWSKENSRDITAYLNEDESFNIKTEYEKQIFWGNNDKKAIEFCATAKNPGIYYGALLFKAEDSNLGIGIWIILNATSGKQSALAKLTGFVVNRADSFSPDKKTLWLSAETFILAVIFSILLIIRK